MRWLKPNLLLGPWVPTTIERFFWLFLLAETVRWLKHMSMMKGSFVIVYLCSSALFFAFYGVQRLGQCVRYLYFGLFLGGGGEPSKKRGANNSNATQFYLDILKPIGQLCWWAKESRGLGDSGWNLKVILARLPSDSGFSPTTTFEN